MDHMATTLCCPGKSLLTVKVLAALEASSCSSWAFLAKSEKVEPHMVDAQAVYPGLGGSHSIYAMVAKTVGAMEHDRQRMM